MNHSTPSYLRIHRGPQRPVASSTDSAQESAETFWDAYRDATGWRIDQRSADRDSSMQLLPAISVDPMDGVETDTLPPVSHRSAVRLAESAAKLAEQLQEAREALRRQEVELAARATIFTDDESRGRVADRIEQTLADAVTACRCDAGVMYLLDDDTQHLKARAAFAMDANTLGQPPRELRGSRGDLEALVQGVVMIDDLNSGPIDTWQCPEPFASGICAAISQDDIPIGTLWLFANETHEFTQSDAASARLAATHLALELSRAATAVEQTQQRHQTNTVGDIATWQLQGLPVGAELADHWHADGMIESPNDWATGWHTWDVLPDGSLMLAMAEAVDPSVVGAMTAAIARAAFTAHCGYRHSPKQLMQRVSDTLWQTNTGEQLMSMLYARIDPETGEGEVASAGSITAMIAGQYGYRPLADGLGQPLTANIESRCAVDTFRLASGETLLGYSKGVISDGATQMMLGDCIRLSSRDAKPHPLSAVRRRLAQCSLENERGMATLTRTR